MQKLNVPVADKPVLMPIETAKSKTPAAIKTIPDIRPFGKLEGLDSKIHEIKMENLQSIFITKIQSVLDLFDKENNHYSDAIMLFVMSAVENNILKPKSGLYKKKIVIECVKSYFDDNLELVDRLIEMIMPTLKQNKLLKRTGKRLLRFFFPWVATK